MGVLIGVFSKVVAEDVLGNGGSCHAVEMGCGGVPEQMGMEMFIDAARVCDIAEDVLQAPG